MEGLASTAPASETELHVFRVESLDQFQQLLRRFRLQRVHLDLLEIAPADQRAGQATFTVVLSATKGDAAAVALLPFLGGKGPEHPATEREARSYLDVLQSRFLFLGYATSVGLALPNLANALPAGRRLGDTVS